MYYAHTLHERPPDEWQPLEEHLKNVAELAGDFASAFRVREWGYLLGLWHDLGKFSKSFQAYLRQRGDYHDYELSMDSNSRATNVKIDHTSAGAQYAVSTISVLGHLLAYPIAGHHAGLHDALADGTCLEMRLMKIVEPWEHGLKKLPEADPPQLPDFLKKALLQKGSDPKRTAFSFSFFVRMLFSCLVDADFLDTERFMDPERANQRPQWPEDTFKQMESALDRYVGAFPADDTPVNRERRRVREACLSAAQEPPGLFSLTVPTGGGKTLSSLAFALRHALLHGLDRVIYVIPFTSIIEQNADVFRQVFSPLVETGLPDPVIEHHSAIDAGRETLESRLAAENWGAPLVVTTSIQFYESLFANRTSRCRKLHNIARSVIILDEAQKLPVEFLHPCLLALQELAYNYGCSVVLCTATQPAVHRREEEFPIGFNSKDVREIIQDTRSLYLALKRVTVKNLGNQTDDALAERLQNHEQVLCIVNTRRHARELFERLKKDSAAIHLSAAMCPAHRAEVLDSIRTRLKNGEPCRVISTQLVEAGVDLDFPVVYRSLAGLDAIAQAAGRCNRNGRLPSAITYVFRSEHRRSEGFVADTANAASQIIGTEGVPPLYDDLLSLEAIEHYFRLYYWSQQDRWDANGILEELKLANEPKLPFLFAFRTMAERFNLIPDTEESVIIPWHEEGKELCEQLKNTWGLPDPGLLRRLRRYTVQVKRRLFLQEIGRSIELVCDRYPMLISPELHYDTELGLVLEREDLGPDLSII